MTKSYCFSHTNLLITLMVSLLVLATGTQSNADLTPEEIERASQAALTTKGFSGSRDIDVIPLPPPAILTTPAQIDPEQLRIQEQIQDLLNQREEAERMDGQQLSDLGALEQNQQAQLEAAKQDLKNAESQLSAYQKDQTWYEGLGDSLLSLFGAEDKGTLLRNELLAKIEDANVRIRTLEPQLENTQAAKAAKQQEVEAYKRRLNLEITKVDPSLSAAEEARRMNEAIEVTRDIQTQRAQITEGLAQFDAKIAELDAAIERLTTGDSAEKEQLQKDKEKIVEARNHFEESMQTELGGHMDRRRMLLDQNTHDGIGPSNSGQVRIAIWKAKGRPEGDLGTIAVDQEAVTAAGESGARIATGAPNSSEHVSIFNEVSAAAAQDFFGDVGQDFSDLTWYEFSLRFGAYTKGVSKGTWNAVKDLMKLLKEGGDTAGESFEAWLEEKYGIKSDVFGSENLALLEKFRDGYVTLWQFDNPEGDKLARELVEMAEKLVRTGERKLEQAAVMDEKKVLEGFGFITATVLGAESAAVDVAAAGIKAASRATDLLTGVNRAEDASKVAGVGVVDEASGLAPGETVTGKAEDLANGSSTGYPNQTAVLPPDQRLSGGLPDPEAGTVLNPGRPKTGSDTGREGTQGASQGEGLHPNLEGAGDLPGGEFRRRIQGEADRLFDGESLVTPGSPSHPPQGSHPNFPGALDDFAPPGYYSDHLTQAEINRLFEPGRTLTREEVLQKADLIIRGRAPRSALQPPTQGGPWPSGDGPGGGGLADPDAPTMVEPGQQLQTGGGTKEGTEVVQGQNPATGDPAAMTPQQRQDLHDARAKQQMQDKVEAGIEAEEPGDSLIIPGRPTHPAQGSSPHIPEGVGDLAPPGYYSRNLTQAEIDRLFEPGRNLSPEEILQKADLIRTGRAPRSGPTDPNSTALLPPGQRQSGGLPDAEAGTIIEPGRRPRTGGDTIREGPGGAGRDPNQTVVDPNATALLPPGQRQGGGLPDPEAGTIIEPGRGAHTGGDTVREGATGSVRDPNQTVVDPNATALLPPGQRQGGGLPDPEAPTVRNPSQRSQRGDETGTTRSGQGAGMSDPDTSTIIEPKKGSATTGTGGDVATPSDGPGGTGGTAAIKDTPETASKPPATGIHPPVRGPPEIREAKPIISNRRDARLGRQEVVGGRLTLEDGRVIELSDPTSQLGAGAFTDVYIAKGPDGNMILGPNGKPLVVKVTTGDGVADALDQVGYQAMRQIDPDGKVIDFPETYSRTRITGDDLDDFNGGSVSVVEQAPDSLRATIKNTTGHDGKMTPGQAIAFDEGMRKINESGWVWVDNYDANYGFKHISGDQWKMSIHDFGGMLPVNGANPIERARNARKIQEFIDNANWTGDAALDGLKGDIARAEILAKKFDGLINWDELHRLRRERLGREPDKKFTTLNTFEESGGVPYNPKNGRQYPKTGILASADKSELPRVQQELRAAGEGATTDRVATGRVRPSQEPNGVDPNQRQAVADPTRTVELPQGARREIGDADVEAPTVVEPGERPQTGTETARNLEATKPGNNDAGGNGGTTTTFMKGSFGGIPVIQPIQFSFGPGKAIPPPPLTAGTAGETFLLGAGEGTTVCIDNAVTQLPNCAKFSLARVLNLMDHDPLFPLDPLTGGPTVTTGIPAGTTSITTASASTSGTSGGGAPSGGGVGAPGGGGPVINCEAVIFGDNTGTDINGQAVILPGSGTTAPPPGPFVFTVLGRGSVELTRSNPSGPPNGFSTFQCTPTGGVPGPIIYVPHEAQFLFPFQPAP